LQPGIDTQPAVLLQTSAMNDYNEDNDEDKHNGNKDNKDNNNNNEDNDNLQPGIDTQPAVLLQTSAMNDILVQQQANRAHQVQIKSISIFPDDRSEYVQVK